MDLGFPLVVIFVEVGNSEREFLAIPGWLWDASLRSNKSDWRLSCASDCLFLGDGEF